MVASKRGASSPRFPPWWERWPQQYEREISAFAKHGVPCEVLAKRNGYLVLKLDWPLSGGELLALRIGFSPMHPFVRPVVSAPEATFERHQHPFSKVLCLLTQESRQWFSGQLVADFIAERLDQLFEALRARTADPQRAVELEEHAADTLAAYFGGVSEEGSVVLFDGAMPVPIGEFGLLDIEYAPRAQGEAPPFQAVLSAIKSANGAGFAKAFRFPSGPEKPPHVPGRWIKVARPPLTNDPDELMRFADDTVAEYTTGNLALSSKYRSVENNTTYLTGIVFRDEVAYGEFGPSWLFVVARKKFNGLGKPLGPAKLTTVRALRAGEGDFFARFPVGKSLRDKKVLLVGCGAIGSFVAAELARSGVGKLTLVDCDILEPGNSVRWPLGSSSWGRSKADALSAFLRSEFPHSKVLAINYRIGEAISDPEETRSANDPVAFFWEQVRDADIVVDTSASTEVQHVLAWLCSENHKSFVMGYATLGAVGGVVARLTTDPVIEWSVLQEAWAKGLMPNPLEETDQTVTPVGCNQPTFAGGSFDVQEISLETVRSVVGLLSPDEYPLRPWAVGQLRLKNELGERIPPSWELFASPGDPL